MERRVVVLMREQLYRHGRRAMFAARYKELGLTAYGKTENQAARNLKLLFNADVRYHRDKGTLESWLNRMGVKWFWADDYGDAYEDTDNIPEQDDPKDAFLPWDPDVPPEALPQRDPHPVGA